MPAGNYGELLLGVAEELCAELPHAGSAEISVMRSTLGAEGLMAGVLDAGDEALATALREALARVAAAAGARPEDPQAQRVLAALDGAEMVIRGELVSGNPEQLPRLLPSLVFMVALPVVEQDRALALSRRASDLTAERFGPPDPR